MISAKRTIFQAVLGLDKYENILIKIRDGKVSSYIDKENR